MKNTKKQNKVKTGVENVPVTSNVNPGTNAQTLHIKKFETKQIVEFLKSLTENSFAISVIVECFSGRIIDWVKAYQNTLEFVISHVTFGDGDIFVISRTTFLNAMCHIARMSPDESKTKRDNGNSTADVSTYGEMKNVYKDVFHTDGVYYKGTFVNQPQFVHAGFNMFHFKKNIFIMKHETYTNLIDCKNSEISCKVIDVNLDNLAPYVFPVDTDTEPNDAEILNV